MVRETLLKPFTKGFVRVKLPLISGSQALLESNRGIESFLKLFSNVMPDFPVFSPFTSLSTPVGRSRESRPIITFEKITFKF